MKRRKKTSPHFQKMPKRNLQRSKERMLLQPKTSLRLLKELKRRKMRKRKKKLRSYLFKIVRLTTRKTSSGSQHT
jgi:hypothetical protein